MGPVPYPAFPQSPQTSRRTRGAGAILIPPTAPSPLEIVLDGGVGRPGSPFPVPNEFPLSRDVPVRNGQAALTKPPGAFDAGNGSTESSLAPRREEPRERGDPAALPQSRSRIPTPCPASPAPVPHPQPQSSIPNPGPAFPAPVPHPHARSHIPSPGTAYPVPVPHPHSRSRIPSPGTASPPLEPHPQCPYPISTPGTASPAPVPHPQPRSRIPSTGPAALGWPRWHRGAAAPPSGPEAVVPDAAPAAPVGAGVGAAEGAPRDGPGTPMKHQIPPRNEHPFAVPPLPCPVRYRRAQQRRAQPGTSHGLGPQDGDRGSNRAGKVQPGINGPVRTGTAGTRNTGCPGSRAPAGMGEGHTRGWAGGLGGRKRGTRLEQEQGQEWVSQMGRGDTRGCEQWVCGDCTGVTSGIWGKSAVMVGTGMGRYGARVGSRAGGG